MEGNKDQTYGEALENISRKITAGRFIKLILKQMEEYGLTYQQAEYVIKKLPEKYKENNERLEKNKPFKVASDYVEPFLD